MAGRQRTRAKVNAALIEAGVSPLQDGVPIPPDIAKAVVIEKRANEKLKTAERKLAHARTVNKGKTLTTNDIKAQLQAILLDVKENAGARIMAAKQLLEMDGTGSVYQKSVLDIRLTQLLPNQVEVDKANFESRS